MTNLEDLTQNLNLLYDRMEEIGDYDPQDREIRRVIDDIEDSYEDFEQDFESLITINESYEEALLEMRDRLEEREEQIEGFDNITWEEEDRGILQRIGQWWLGYTEDEVEDEATTTESFGEDLYDDDEDNMW